MTGRPWHPKDRRGLTVMHYRAAELRYEYGLTDADIGRELGYSKPTVALWLAEYEQRTLIDPTSPATD